MGEKIKDLIYDFSDIIISLVIITLIFGVVSWKISDSMAYNMFTDEASDASLTANQPDTNKDAANAPGDNTVATSNTDQVTTGANTASDGKPSAGGTVAPPTNTTPPPSNTTPPPAQTGDFKVVIPSGSSGIAIAKILKEQNIISDTKMFITRVDQLKLGPKLKAGTFTIKSGSSLDDVIYTLAGKKK